MNRPRCIVFIALSASIALCGPLAPGVSAFSRTAIDGDSEWRTDANGIKLASSRISDPASRITGGYDEVGNLKQVLYPNSVKHQYTYNALNRLELLIDRNPANTIINCWRYRATPAGQRTWVEEFDKRTAWYRYDSLGRLQSETVTGSIQDGKNGVVTYGYDSVGNRLTRTSSLSGVTNQTFGYDTDDRLNGDQYDSNGNTITSPNILGSAGASPAVIGAPPITGTDSYDSDNRLTQRTAATGSNVRLVYDGDGNRVCEIVNGQIKSYLIDNRNPTGYAQVVEEVVNGTVNHTYTYGHDLISQDQLNTAGSAWKASFYCYDGRGTVRFLTDETGAVTDTYTYDAFGTLITATGSTNNRYLYSGEQFDPNLGLYYLRARLMNPLTGRFWSMDSYEGSGSEPQSLHKYLYADADPANRIDPTGHFGLTDLAIAMHIRATTFASSALRYAPVAYAARAAITAASLFTLYELVTNEEFRQDFVALAQASGGNPTVALGTTIEEGSFFLGYLATDVYRFGSAAIARSAILPQVEGVLGSAASKIKALHPDALVGYRGSLANLFKGPHKDFAPFNPQSFDVDAFVVSDSLAAKINPSGGFRDIRSVGELGGVADDVRSALSNVNGFQSQRGFTFRVFTTREYAQKGGQLLEE